jgi:pseudouridine kinase
MPTSAPSSLFTDSCRAPIVLVGGANMDIAAHTHLDLVPADSTPGQIQCAPGGVARNVAENLARLGHDCHLVSLVGDDVFGKSLLEATQAAGVKVAALGTQAAQRTATYLSLHGPDGDMAVAINDMAILDGLTPDHLQTHWALLQRAACVVLDCNLTPAALAWLLTQACVAPVFVDAVSVAKCLRIMPWLTHIHTLKVNRLEAQALTGLPVQSVDEACLAAVHLHQSGVRHVVISLGAQGVCWCDAQGATGHRAARPMRVVNTSGAGDALLAGLVHVHQNGLYQTVQPMARAVEFAMGCAELTLASPFANAPQLSEAAVQAGSAQV